MAGLLEKGNKKAPPGTEELYFVLYKDQITSVLSHQIRTTSYGLSYDG